MQTNLKPSSSVERREALRSNSIIGENLELVHQYKRGIAGSLYGINLKHGGRVSEENLNQAMELIDQHKNQDLGVVINEIEDKHPFSCDVVMKWKEFSDKIDASHPSILKGGQTSSEFVAEIIKEQLVAYKDQVKPSVQNKGR